MACLPTSFWEVFRESHLSSVGWIIPKKAGFLAEWKQVGHPSVLRIMSSVNVEEITSRYVHGSNKKHVDDDEDLTVPKESNNQTLCWNAQESSETRVNVTCKLHFPEACLH